MDLLKKVLTHIAGKLSLIACLLLILINTAHSNEDNPYKETKGFVEGAGYIETIGIPSPPYDVAQKAPYIDESQWVTPQDGLYYINATANNASDSTNGTPSSPRQTIPSPIPPGSYIIIEGEYGIAPSGFSMVNAQGNNDEWKQGASGPIWLVGKKAVFTRGVLIEGSDLFVENIQFGLKSGDSSGGGYYIGSAKPRLVKNIVIRNCEFNGRKAESGYRGALVVAGVNAQTPAKNIFIFDNKFQNHGDVNADYDEDFHMLQIDKGVDGYWFINNQIEFSSGSGLQILGTTDSTKNIYIGSNTITNVRQAGVGIKYGRDIVISQNVFKDIIDTRPLYEISRSPSKGVGYQYAPDNLWILFNDISNASFGIYGGSDTGTVQGHIYVIGNYIHDINTPDGVEVGGGAWADAAIMLIGGKYRYIVNNTIRNVNAGIYGPSRSKTLYNISQNVVSGVTLGEHIYIEAGSSAHFDGNNDGENKSYLSSSLDGLTVDTTNGVRWAGDIGQLQSLTIDNACKGGTCFYSDKIFIGEETSLSQGGAKLIADTNGHDRGTKHYVYTLFNELYGLNINFDIYGSKRTGIWDIGSYENPAPAVVIDSTVPARPSSLEATTKY
jgi:hypothetical protein